MHDGCRQVRFFEGCMRTEDGVTRSYSEGGFGTWTSAAGSSSEKLELMAAEGSSEPEANLKRCEPCLVQVARYLKQTRYPNRRGGEKPRGRQPNSSTWWWVFLGDIWQQVNRLGRDCDAGSKGNTRERISKRGEGR